MKANGCVVVFCLSFRRERRAVGGRWSLSVVIGAMHSAVVRHRQNTEKFGFFFPSGRHVVSVTLLFFI